MTATHKIDPIVWMINHLTADNSDPVRDMLKHMAELLMSAEAEVLCNAGYGEISAGHVTKRNGYRPRDWDTRVGTIELGIPKLRKGSYFPDWLLEPRRRSEQALWTAIATAYLAGSRLAASTSSPKRSASTASASRRCHASRRSWTPR